MNVEPTNTPQHQVIVVPPGGGGGGGFFGRLVGAIIASCLISGIGYFATYTTLFARLWLKNEGATVEMPAEKHAKTSVVERSRGVLGDTIGKIKEQLARTKDTAAGGFEKARETAPRRQKDRTQSRQEGRRAQGNAGKTPGGIQEKT